MTKPDEQQEPLRVRIIPYREEKQLPVFPPYIDDYSSPSMLHAPRYRTHEAIEEAKRSGKPHVERPIIHWLLEYTPALQKIEARFPYLPMKCRP